jgi:hypothetical protein
MENESITTIIDINVKLNQKIKTMSDEIKLRLSVPINCRTDKQAIKLDNLNHELNLLINEYHKNNIKVKEHM